MVGDSHNHATRNTVTIRPKDTNRPREEVLDNRNFVKPSAKLDIRKNFFSHRVVEVGNY